MECLHRPTVSNPQNYYRAEGLIRNYDTLEEFRQVDKAAHVERAGRMIWDAICDGTIYSCPSLLCSFTAICFADLKKYRFTYHFAYPCLHSDPVWKLVAPAEKEEEEDKAAAAAAAEGGRGVKKLGPRETEALVSTVQTWRYSVDARQHGFFLAKRLRKEVLEAQWRSQPRGSGEIEEEQDDDGNMNFAAQKRRKSRTHSLGELGFLWSVASLASYETGFFDNVEAMEDRFVCFADPSTYPANPGWALRNLLVLVRKRWRLDEVQVLCYRDTHARREHPTSLVLRLRSAVPVNGVQQPQQSGADIPLRSLQPDNTVSTSANPNPPPTTTSPPSSSKPNLLVPKITGWERTDQNKLTSRTVDLAAYMDPTKLADQAVDLNLKLIKWRIAPSLDLDLIKNTSCLLLGAGTLGCYVARGLMAWGVRKITFVDNGRVSYSNPVRQPLFDFKDCEGGGVKKAERAADALAQIYPGVQAEGVCLSVPMVGHASSAGGGAGDEGTRKAEFERLRG